MLEDVRVIINGNDFIHYSELSISRDMESIASSFEMSVFKIDKDFPIWKGDKIQIKIGEHYILTGRIEYLNAFYNETESGLILIGRDNIGDLVDCSHTGKVYEFTGRQSVTKIVAELCKPFSIDVKSELKTEDYIDSFKIDPGEKIFEALEKIAKSKGLIFQPTGEGNLVITKINDDGPAILLTEGDNIVSASLNLDDTNRFSEYRILGQSTDRKTVLQNAHDMGIKNYRPIEIVSFQNLSIQDAKKRAQWEAATRYGRSKAVYVEVPGWTIGKEAWKPNSLCMVNIPKILICEEKMLIRSTEMRFGETGTYTTLSLAEPAMFKLEPVINKDNPDKSLSRLKALGYGS